MNKSHVSPNKKRQVRGNEWKGAARGSHVSQGDKSSFLLMGNCPSAVLSSQMAVWPMHRWSPTPDLPPQLSLDSLFLSGVGNNQSNRVKKRVGMRKIRGDYSNYL